MSGSGGRVEERDGKQGAAGGEAAEGQEDNRRVQAAMVRRARIRKAEGFNEAHAELVAEFNQMTAGACAGGRGGVDVAKLIEWQRAHGVTADGKLGPKTVEAARREKPNGEAASTESDNGAPGEEGKPQAKEAARQADGDAGAQGASVGSPQAGGGDRETKGIDGATPTETVPALAEPAMSAKDAMKGQGRPSEAEAGANPTVATHGKEPHLLKKQLAPPQADQAEGGEEAMELEEPVLDAKAAMEADGSKEDIYADDRVTDEKDIKHLGRDKATENPGETEDPSGTTVGRVKDKRYPERLVSVPHGFEGKAVELGPATAKAYEALLANARAAGFEAPVFDIMSAFRTDQHQAKIVAEAEKTHPGENNRKFVASAGGSAHRTGHAIDFYLGVRNQRENVSAQEKLPAYKWLKENAASFGFAPYKAEPWHWEYNPGPDAKDEEGEGDEDSKAD